MFEGSETVTKSGRAKIEHYPTWLTSQQPSLKPNEYCVSPNKVQSRHTIILTHATFTLQFVDPNWYSVTQVGSLL